MKKELKFLLALLILYIISISVEVIEFIPSWSKLALVFGWILFAIFFSLSIWRIFYVRRKRSNDQEKGKIIFHVLLLLIGGIMKFFLFAIGSTQENMFPRRLIDVTEVKSDNTSVYLFALDAFPDPGENIIIKRRMVAFPIMKEIGKVNSFDFSKKESFKDSLIYYSKSGKIVSYIFDCDSITIRYPK